MEINMNQFFSAGEICFGTTKASKIYINLDTPFVNSLRERFAAICDSVEFTQSSHVKKRVPEEEMFINRMTIKELIETQWSSNLKVNFKLSFTLTLMYIISLIMLYEVA